MNDFLRLGAILWVFGTLIWFVIFTVLWLDERDFDPQRDTLPRLARRALQAPLWPLVTLSWLGRTIGAMAVDSTRRRP